MGYDIHITRQNNWFEDNQNQKISLNEWKYLLAGDTEMRLDNFAEAATSAGTLRIEREGLAVWTKYSGDGLNGNHAWFYYNNGNIIVKNPDNEIISKMLDLAKRLNAKVQGDEGEIYECSANKEIVYNLTAENNNKQDRRKPWWKLFSP